MKLGVNTLHNLLTKDNCMNSRISSDRRGVAPAKGHGGAPDHSLRAGGGQLLLTSQSPRFAHGSLREGL